MNKKWVLVNICGFYLLHYMTMGVFTPYVNVYYERIGFSGSQIGMISLIGLLCAMLCAPLFGILCDKTKSDKGVIIFLMIASATSMFFWSTQSTFIGVLFASTLLLIFRSDIGSLSDSMAVKFCNKDGYDFGFVRSIGSLGYLVGSFVVANFLVSKGYQGPFVYCYILFMILGAILISFVPKQNSEEKVEKNEFSLLKDGKELLKNKDFQFIIVIMIFSIMTIDCAVAYAGNHLVSTLGQADSLIGIFSCAMVLPEVFMVMYIGRFIKRFGLKKLYIVACLSQIIRLLVYAMSGNIFLFLFASTLHGIMIGAGGVGNVEFMHQRIPSKMLSTAMSIYGAIYTIGTALFSQVFGIIYQYGSSNMIFLVAALLSVIPLLMVCFSKRIS